jgi:hypothetical protein
MFYANQQLDNSNLHNRNLHNSKQKNASQALMLVEAEKENISTT